MLFEQKANVKHKLVAVCPWSQAVHSKHGNITANSGLIQPALDRYFALQQNLNIEFICINQLYTEEEK